jgi:hypothetical protein
VVSRASWSCDHHQSRPNLGEEHGHDDDDGVGRFHLETMVATLLEDSS